LKSPITAAKKFFFALWTKWWSRIDFVEESVFSRVDGEALFFFRGATRQWTRNKSRKIVESPAVRRAIFKIKKTAARILHLTSRKTLAEFVYQSGSENIIAPTHPQDGREWKRISSDEMYRPAPVTWRRTYSLGLIEKGDRLRLLAANSPEWTDAAVNLRGVIDAPLTRRLAPTAVQYIVNDAGARILKTPNATRLMKFCPTPEKIVFSRRRTSHLKTDARFPSWWAGAEVKRSESGIWIKDLTEAVAPHDVAT